MDDGLEVGVVEVEGVRGDAVDQRGAGHVHLFGAAQHAGLRRGLQQLDRGQGGIGGFVVRRTDGAAQPVQEGAVRFMIDGVAPAAAGKGVVGDEFGQDVGDGRGVVVGGDLGVAGHGCGSFGKGVSCRAGCCGPCQARSSGRCRRG